MTDLRSSHRPARKIYRSLAALLAALFFSSVLTTGQAFAAVYGGFSLGTGEEFNDNIFFRPDPGKRYVNDWITHIVPNFTLFYATPGDPTPVLTAAFAPEGQIYAHNSRLNNFGDNLTFDSAYTLKYAPNLTFNFVDNMRRYGVTRTIG